MKGEIQTVYVWGKNSLTGSQRKKIKTNFYFYISYYRIFKCIIVLIPPTAKDTGLAEEVRGKSQEAEQVHETLS